MTDPRCARTPRAVFRIGRWVLNGVAGLTLGFILLPLVLVTWLAFFRQEIPSFPPEGYSLQWFGAVLNNKSFVVRIHPELSGRRDGDLDRARARGAREPCDRAAALSPGAALRARCC